MLHIDDGHWIRCMEETASFSSGITLRKLFATLLEHCNIAEPNSMWEQFQDNMCEDFLHQHRTATRNPLAEITPNIRNQALRSIQMELQLLGRDLHDYDLPQPTAIEEPPPPAWDEHRAYNRPVLQQRIADAVLNEEQTQVWTTVRNAMDDTSGNTDHKAFFLEGVAGTGKTFV
jgi:primosomal protein N'